MATGAVLGLSQLSDSPGVLVGTLLLVAYNTGRTLRPLPRPGNLSVSEAALGVDLAVALTAVGLSGGWGSPFIFSLLVAVLLAGFTRGYTAGLLTAGLIVGFLGLAALVFPSARADPETASQAALVCAATAAVAGYARRLFLEAEESQAAFSDRLTSLTEANALLSQLTRVAQTLPSSLDLGNTLAGAMGHLRQLFDFSGAAVLIHDPATGLWRTEAAAGHAAPAPFTPRGLPEPLKRAAAGSDIIAEPELDPDRGRPGLWPSSRSGLYGPLRARDRLIALVTLEHDEPDRFGNRQVQLLAGLVDPLALAIDNGLWFDRLRVLGAEGERDRLARGLHDRIGQGLAYVGLELDRLSRKPELQGSDEAAGVGSELLRLRGDVAGLLAEVRETLRQLRAQVTEATGLAELAEQHIARFSERTGIAVQFEADPSHPRLPVPIEQELWRILQEALANVDRHSEASYVVVRWKVTKSGALLEIVDDGVGFDPTESDSRATAGLMAMRERANAIGARLVIDSKPRGGTRLTVQVEVTS